MSSKTPTPTPTPAISNSTQVLPCEHAITNALKLAIAEDKPIMMDYWDPSLSGVAIIGIKADKNKMLIKSESEYTSNIAKLFRAGNTMIVMTENSIYLVHSDIKAKAISG